MLSESPRKAAKKIASKIDGLKSDPAKQGKPLRDDLNGYRSIAAAGRYRIIYFVSEDDAIVTVVATGIRKDGDKSDVYELAAKIQNNGDLLS